MTAPFAERPTYEGIQVLRFVAALMVVVSHAYFYTVERLAPDMWRWTGGDAGVDIFFLISGFVMVVSTAHTFGRSDAWHRFATKRILRIVPLYWIATTVNVLILLLLPSTVLHSVVDIPHIVSSYFFIPTADADGAIKPLLGVGWTLVFEMFFYAIFTLALLLRVNVYAFVGVIMSVCALLSLFRQVSWPVGAFYFNPIVMEFFIGMIIARYVENIRFPEIIATVALLSSMFWLLFLSPNFEDLPRLIDRGIPASLILISVVSLERLVSGRIHRSLLFLGAASYSIYLFHPMISPAVPVVLSKLSLDWVAISIIGCVVVGVAVPSIIYSFLEKPMTERLHYWLGMPSRSRKKQPAE